LVEQPLLPLLHLLLLLLLLLLLVRLDLGLPWHLRALLHPLCLALRL
jgi:hypothetical protein